MKVRFHDLKLIFVDYSLGKFYTYFKNINGVHHRHPIIEMNINMWHYDKKLFFWVLSHELDHKEFYMKEENWNKAPYLQDLKQHIPNKHNLRMTMLIGKFELKHRDKCFKKGFATNDNKELLFKDGVIQYACEGRLTKEDEEEILRKVV